MAQAIRIVSVNYLNHNVLEVVAEKPKALNYYPGQAASISVNKKGWKHKIRAFALTSLPQDDFIEFNIKVYPSRKRTGVFHQLEKMGSGEELIFHNIEGNISYHGEGLFIAGGAGITPFLSIFKKLEQEDKIGNNKLIYANRTQADILREDKFHQLLGEQFINVLSEEDKAGYEYGVITKEIIQKAIEPTTKYFYLCGPPPMMTAVLNHLSELQVDENDIIKESF